MLSPLCPLSDRRAITFNPKLLPEFLCYLMESQQIAVRHGRTGPEMKRNANARNGRLDARSREKTGSSMVSRMKILFSVRPFLIRRVFRTGVSSSGLDWRSLAFPRPSSRKSQPTFGDGTTAVGRIPSLRSPFHHRFIPNTSPRLLSRYPCRLDLYRNQLLPGPGGREGSIGPGGSRFVTRSIRRLIQIAWQPTVKFPLDEEALVDARPRIQPTDCPQTYLAAIHLLRRVPYVLAYYVRLGS